MVSQFLLTRRRHIASKGRAMELRRPTTTGTYVSVPLRGILRGYAPEQIAGDVRQGDSRVLILNDEILLLGWPGPPRPRDTVVVDGRAWAVLGARAKYEGDALIGFDLWVRGG